MDVVAGFDHEVWITAAARWRSCFKPPTGISDSNHLVATGLSSSVAIAKATITRAITDEMRDRGRRHRATTNCCRREATAIRRAGSGLEGTLASAPFDLPWLAATVVAAIIRGADSGLPDDGGGSSEQLPPESRT